TLSSVDDDNWQGFSLQAKSFTSSVNHQALGMKDVSNNHYTSTAPIFIKNNDEQYECAHQDGAIDVAKYIVNEIQTNAKSPMAKMIKYHNQSYQRLEEWLKSPLWRQFLSPPP